ncbi:MAG TPA: hypothetical protein VFZ46_04880 [Nitrososphaeraceae archaeon]
MEKEEEITQQLELNLEPEAEWQTHYLTREVGNKNGTFVVNFTNRFVKCSSPIVVSATEHYGGCGRMGDAKIQVLNVSPYDGGFRVRINVNWPDPIPIRVHIFMRVYVTP